MCHPVWAVDSGHIITTRFPDEPQNLYSAATPEAWYQPFIKSNIHAGTGTGCLWDCVEETEGDPHTSGHLGDSLAYH